MKQGQETNKYEHKRQENRWHTQQNPDITPPSGRRVPRRNSSTGEGGGRFGGPSGQTRTGTQDGDLQSGTDRQGPWRCRELRWPWQGWELWRPWRSWELWRPWQMVFGALASVPSARPLQPELILPPPPNFPGEVRGYQEPSGAKQTGQYKTRQESPPGPDRQDRTAHRNRKPSRAS